MILALDTYYLNNKARTVALVFQNWEDSVPQYIHHSISGQVAEYEPGLFYKRELPCIIRLLQQTDLAPIRLILIDGFVQLDDEGSPGLGAHLYNWLNPKIPVAGIAKTRYAKINTAQREVFRGQSKNPLLVTAIGTDLDEVASGLKRMYGAYRIPELLRLLDSETRKEG